jgi:nitroreductase
MEFYEAVARRRTIREFASALVPEEKIRKVLEAGLKAPSNAHLKHWHFILLHDRAERNRTVTTVLRARDLNDPQEIEAFISRFDEENLKKIYRKSLPLQLTMMLQAPELLIVCYKTKPFAECRTLFELNPLASVWMCIENIMLAFAAEGLFGCTYTPYDTSGLKTHLGVPAGYEIATLIPFGFPKEEPCPGETIVLDERLHFNKW